MKRQDGTRWINIFFGENIDTYIDASDTNCPCPAEFSQTNDRAASVDCKREQPTSWGIHPVIASLRTQRMCGKLKLTLIALIDGTKKYSPPRLTTCCVGKLITPFAEDGLRPTTARLAPFSWPMRGLFLLYQQRRASKAM